MSALDLPPGLGLEGTPLAVFVAPARARRLTTIAVVSVVGLLVLSWYFVSRHPYRRQASTQVVLPAAFLLIALLAFALRRAKLAITRDGVRWGWTSLAFTQPRERLINVHVYTDGITLEIQRGARWFLAARDWERFEVLVRQLRRVDLPTRDYTFKAPLRQRMQSYGRFLDALTVGCIVGAFAVALWAA
ncbi:MAG: hypothetical protein SFX73_28430 [Kofleriaceae bacterium]|nr:hypothetical protein [Kofleriaceae bacterium]